MHAEFCKTNLTKYKQIKMFIHIHTFILMILGLNRKKLDGGRIIIWKGP
jgi:hypothetical protein